MADATNARARPIAVLAVDEEHPFPKNQQLDLVQILDLLDAGITLLSNAIVNVTNLFGFGAVELDPPPPASFRSPGTRGAEDTGAIAAFRAKIGHAVVYFTRLGDYNQHRATPWFRDPRVTPALDAFQANLREVERKIGARNLERPCYEFLLPSRIPQSINI